MVTLNKDRLHAQLILEEGLRLMAYDDATGYPVPPGGVCRGKLTVGVGHNLDANPLTADELAAVGHDGRKQPITRANAIMILDNDITVACYELDRHVPWCESLDEIRARVMVDLSFNMGINKLMGFQHFLGYMNQGQYDHAASELENSVWYDQVGARGVRLAGMVRSGEDYTS